MPLINKRFLSMLRIFFIVQRIWLSPPVIDWMENSDIFKYEKEIMKKTYRTREQSVMIMHQLKDIINIIPKEEYSKFVVEAGKFSPDPKDIMYFALAMKLNAGIWSNDGRLKKQDKVTIYTTSDLMKLI